MLPFDRLVLVIQPWDRMPQARLWILAAATRFGARFRAKIDHPDKPLFISSKRSLGIVSSRSCQKPTLPKGGAANIFRRVGG